MTDPTRSDTGEAPGAAERPRGQRWVLVAGLVLLVVGVAVCVLGRLAASSASDDLATANRRLHDQRLATASARRCEASLRGAVAPLLSTANSLVSTASAIADQDAQIVAALRDGQAAGAQTRIDDYNNARDRGNAAANAANAAIATARSQSATLDQQANALPTNCPGSAAATSANS
jgi:hypothetical protein